MVFQFFKKSAMKYLWTIIIIIRGPTKSVGTLFYLLVLLLLFLLLSSLLFHQNIYLQNTKIKLRTFLIKQKSTLNINHLPQSFL